jgi:hypothetical protein
MPGRAAVDFVAIGALRQARAFGELRALCRVENGLKRRRFEARERDAGQRDRPDVEVEEIVDRS